MKLDELEIGKDAIIESVDSGDAVLRQHIFDMGLTPGTEVTMMKYAPRARLPAPPSRRRAHLARERARRP